MLNYAHRFHGRGSLKRIHAHSQTIRGPLMSLKYNQNNHRTTWRCAIVVSRKVHGSAVVRNRIRRRIYAAVRRQAEQLKGPYDLIFIVFSDQLAKIPHIKLQELVNSCLNQAHLLNNQKTIPPQRDIINQEEK